MSAWTRGKKKARNSSKKRSRASRQGLSKSLMNRLLLREGRDPTRRRHPASSPIKRNRLTGLLWAVILERMSDVTCILNAIEQGDPQAAEHLLPLAYAELRHLEALNLVKEMTAITMQS